MPSRQRALVFQGGGSLGAYEAGVFHVLCHWIKKDLSDNENVFDIIAGTSIGAVNASIIINDILEKKNQEKSSTEEAEKYKKTLKYWEGTPEKLIQFWKNVSSNTNTPWDPWNLYDFYTSFIESYVKFNYQNYLNLFPYLRELLPSSESFRRYYHTQMSLVRGESHIFSPLFIYPFATPVPNKFFDYFSPTAKWYQYSNLPLRQSIAGSASMLRDNNTKRSGIRTVYDEKEPRLLLVAVDISEAKSTTFDSYKEDITINHVLASAAVPKNYPYVDINGNKYWDGGILSNTPIREVLSEHSKLWVKRLGIDDYDSSSHSKKDLSYEKEKEWFKEEDEQDKRKNKDKNEKRIPNLDLCIVNLYPSKEKGEQIPSLYDYDFTKDRENDIRFHDKTEYDVKLANVVTDYKDFVERMAKLAIKSIEEIKDKVKLVAELKEEFIGILGKNQTTLTRDEKPRYYYDLLQKRFEIKKTIEIQREDDIHTIASKALDFSSATINHLIKQGITDTLDKIYQDQKENDKESFKRWLSGYIKDIENQSTKDLLNPVLEFKDKERL
ncbi:MAG TPA: patatin-like phospholipase family protein [Nitrososphaeraceae archaeon]|nr:patatin-like phospholipase family protein [Nitrososphaeraceae archaeon]